jgi:hypothetical protein
LRSIDPYWFVVVDAPVSVGRRAEPVVDLRKQTSDAFIWSTSSAGELRATGVGINDNDFILLSDTRSRLERTG